jgi:hypothetical protein
VVVPAAVGKFGDLRLVSAVYLHHREGRPGGLSAGELAVVGELQRDAEIVLLEQ